MIVHWRFCRRRNQRSTDVARSLERFPANNPSIPIASSRSGQWMSEPAPLIWKLARSAGVLYAKRGYLQLALKEFAHLPN